MSSNDLDALVQTVKTAPNHAPAWLELGLALDGLGELSEALSCFERASELEPKRFEFQRRLAFACVKLGQAERAVRHYERAMTLDARDVEVVLELAAVHRALGRVENALVLYRKALRLDPSQVEVHNDVGNVLYVQGKFDEAIAAYEAAVARDPSYAAAYANLGNAQKDVALHRAALASFTRALELDPGDAVSHASLLFSLGFNPDYDARAIFGAAQRFGSLHTQPLKPSRPTHQNAREPQRKLKIGYVSSDFREHVSRFYLDGLLAAHDRSQFQIFCYSNVFPGDAWTQRYRARADVFRDVWSLDDEAAAQLILADQIDILIDLTMHSGSARPLLFARKPAPVQICWLAYVGTTGNDAMDYRITDPYLDPPGTDLSLYTERSLHLPHTFWCYDSQASEAVVAPLPALRAGHITFGAFGSFCKVNAPTLGLWARVLRSVAGSRLLLHAPPGAARARTLAVFEQHGVSTDAVTFAPHLPRPAYLARYAQIDVCLDSLPYNGLSNTLDAAWMGVPTLTLVGATVAGRAAASVAANLGLHELAARTPEELVAKAVRISEDLPALQALRGELRARLQSSPLMDAPRFARDLEAAYREAWCNWCEERAV
jgi:protein O-GlcNAc transferase